MNHIESDISFIPEISVLEIEDSILLPIPLPRSSAQSFTSAFREHLLDATDVADADRVHGLHGYRVFGSTLQAVDGVCEPVGVHVYPFWLVVTGPVGDHVTGDGHGAVRLLDRFPLDQYGTGRDRIRLELGRRRRIQHVDRVRYLIPAEHVLHVTRVVTAVRFVVHGAHGQTVVRENPVSKETNQPDLVAHKV